MRRLRRTLSRFWKSRVRNGLKRTSQSPEVFRIPVRVRRWERWCSRLVCRRVSARRSHRCRESRSSRMWVILGNMQLIVVKVPRCLKPWATLSGHGQIIGRLRRTRRRVPTLRVVLLFHRLSKYRSHLRSSSGQRHHQQVSMGIALSRRRYLRRGQEARGLAVECRMTGVRIS